MGIETLLSRLNTRVTGKRTYMARCPAHDDRAASLSILEKNDGTVLLNCFAGCETRDVLEALGLGFKDLYPSQTRKPSFGLSAREAISLISKDADLLAIIAHDLREGRASEEDLKKAIEAAARISQVKHEVLHG